ncbi:hypothetical protein [Aeromonas taiwanensis]|uniref:hypothetical protein n=1 Tax=Aeromonas taiwanensis TaxID=633417 RepID=UPI003B9E4380
MKLGDQAVSRANTGLQGLFKKYLQKIVSLKIKWLYAAEQNAAGREWGIKRGGAASEGLCIKIGRGKH